jgi:hypothetical protein
MFCSRLDSRMWCPSEGLLLCASSYLADELLAPSYPNRDSIVFSSNLRRKSQSDSGYAFEFARWSEQAAKPARG